MSNKPDFSNYEIHKSPIVISYRLIILLLGLGDLVYANVSFLLSGQLSLSTFPDKYFTYQSNIFILAWLFLALIWRNMPEKLDKISGSLRGAITVYITVTFIVYGIVLAPQSNPTGIDIYLNIIHHYLNPVVFIVDFFYTERKVYNWKPVIVWFVYPHLYLIFSFIMGTYLTVGDYIYPFLNYPKLGFTGYLIWYLTLIVLFLILSVIYYLFPVFMKKRNSSAKTGS